MIEWTVGGQTQHARWRSEAAVPAPRKLQVVDDTLSADAAYRLICDGTSLLWQGDYHNARQLLQALQRRVERRVERRPQKAAKPTSAATEGDAALAFYRHRQAQGQRARVLSALLIPVQADRSIPLRRAPDVRLACEQAWGAPDGEACVVALRELLGVVGAYEWRKRGVEIPALGPAPSNRIYPHYGVFSPVRGEYLDLVAQAPLPSKALAFDIGVGTGVISAVLARRGVARVVGTDVDPRALACAQANLDQLGLAAQVQLQAADMFPAGRAPLVVCNPPWLPARPSSPVERAVYDEDSRMLRHFLLGLPQHLEPGGEGWLILSDLAEHLGLRSRAQWMAWVQEAGLVVHDRIDIRPRHPKSADTHDALHAARAAEVTSLWRLRCA